MKICLVHEEYPKETNFGGIATYQKLIGKYLSMLGHKVIVIARGLKEDQDYYEDKIRVIRIYNPSVQNAIEDYKNYRLKVSRKIEELVNQGEIDVIETPDWGAETIMYFNKRSVPVVVKLHTPLCVWQEHNKIGLNETVNDTMLQWEKEIILNADKIVSCSSILLDKLKKYYPTLDYSKILVVPNPANTEKFVSFPGQKSNTILYVGSLEQRKGVDILAKAIPIFLEKIDSKVIFKFIGKDTNRNDKNISMIEYIKELVPSKYHNNLEFVEQLDNEILINYYNEAMIGVVPSRFDNLPYVAQEMLLSGLAVIASDNTGVREMIVDGESGILFKNLDYQDLANKLIYLYNSNDKRKTIGENAQKIILSKHNPMLIAKTMEKV